MHKFAKWFRAAMWLGIIVNWLLALPALFFPNALLRGLGQSPSDDTLWTAFAANLLILLSLLYVPAAIDPFRYKLTAIFAVIARAVEVCFFFILWPGRYPAFGLVDGIFLIIQAPLLYLAYHEMREEWQPYTSTT